jgi:hypothetical protein
MAKKATSKGGAKGRPGAAKKSAKAKPRVPAKPRPRTGGSQSESASEEMGEAFIKLLQSPLIADLVAVAATAALASLAEHGFTHRGADESSRRNRAGKAVKEAGKAAAAAVGRRLSIEIDEIRAAAKEAKAGAKA